MILRFSFKMLISFLMKLFIIKKQSLKKYRASMTISKIKVARDGKKQVDQDGEPDTSLMPKRNI